VRLPASTRARQLGRTAEQIIDLADEVDPERDHLRGSADAPVTLVEYADFECPYCGQAEPMIRELLAENDDGLRYVFRHLPLSDVHPHAQMAAEAAEAAGVQGAFWAMHDRLFDHQDRLTLSDLRRHAEELDLDVERFVEDLRQRRYASRVSDDVASADASGVSGTPSFFINGRRHHGVYDVDTLTRATDGAAGATLAVGQHRWDRDAPTTADLHARHALIPAGDHVALTQTELERVTAVPRGIELLATGPGDADIVDLDHAADDRLLAVSHDEVLQLQLV
jgi:protein-disulfide isomerase